jgi:hypothetical protein
LLKKSKYKKLFFYHATDIIDNQFSDNREQMADVRGQMSEGRGQMTEERRWEVKEVRR